MEQVVAVDEDVIENVVRTFYARVRRDNLLGPIFAEHIKDWEPHLHNMFAFWSAVMLQSGRYHGRPMPKHVALPVKAAHFDRWLEIFNETVNEICVAEDAALFQKKAAIIAGNLELGVAHYQGASPRADGPFMQAME